jgi:hypothetical protein
MPFGTVRLGCRGRKGGKVKGNNKNSILRTSTVHLDVEIDGVFEHPQTLSKSKNMLGI